MDLPGQQFPSANAMTPLDHILNLDIKAPPGCQRLTGIIAAMGEFIIVYIQYGPEWSRA